MGGYGSICQGLKIKTKQIKDEVIKEKKFFKIVNVITIITDSASTLKGYRLNDERRERKSSPIINTKPINNNR